MTEKVLYSYTGLFDTPDEIINAAKKTSEKGYKKFDVNTPYPVHGMDGAMKLPPSRLGYAALVFGLSGTFAALLMMAWMSVFDYPNIIGGKPFFAFPAYVPIMFEVTVLSAAIATVSTMLMVFFKLPNNSHPLHGTEYMKAVSSDKYGVTIMAEDKLFDENEVKEFLSSIGAKNISPVYYDNDDLSIKNVIFEPKFVSFLLIIFVLVSGATYLTLNKLMFLPPFTWMASQSKSIPQEKSDFFKDGWAMRTPVKGSIARGFLPFKYSGKPELAGKNLVNPLPMDEKVLQLGRKKFNTYCSPCHGNFAKGDSRLRGQFPNPPSLHSEKVRNWSDGRIYDVIVEGQNVMPSYSYQLNREERWAVINYIRVLQRAFNAKESDLK